MIQLNYKDGTPYNDDKHTPRATLITFLCDRDAGVGVPEYQVGIVCWVGAWACLPLVPGRLPGGLWKTGGRGAVTTGLVMARVRRGSHRR